MRINDKNFTKLLFYSVIMKSITWNRLFRFFLANNLLFLILKLISILKIFSFEKYKSQSTNLHEKFSSLLVSNSIHPIKKITELAVIILTRSQKYLSWHLQAYKCKVQLRLASELILDDTFLNFLQIMKDFAKLKFVFTEIRLHELKSNKN